MSKNKESTRYYSDQHEKSVCKALNCNKTSNSGASTFSCGDVYNEDADILLECKCQMTNKESMSIKKTWLEKLRTEAWEKRFTNTALCFNFGPDTPNYYVINETLMKFLIEKLNKEEKSS